ncbi:PPOX class F420-dependent oxidoreductase [Nocardia sp. NPDC058633]|uniref:PPOX class F420-dependent oxidoreductase n=1 Tax=Nocardia sp. NPDC058633 TaxID=3346568 RepID=UPI00364D6905
MTNRLGELATANYVLLTTFRKDGTPVGTPLWAAARDDKLYVWTVTDSWKVKRIRRNPEVTLQPCNARGAAHGATVPATARLLDAAETDQVRGAIRRKYWLTGPLVILASNLRRGKTGTIGIEITPA